MTALRSVVCAMVGLVLLAASARGGWYSGEVVADNPVGYWRLGESTGPTASDSVGANDGGYGGGVTLGVPGAIVGGSDTAVSFDGSSGRVVVPFTAALNPPAYTAELWAKVDGGAGSWRSPLTNRDHLPPPGTGQRGYLFYAGTNNRWQFWGGTGTGWQSQNGPSVQDGEWAHLAGTYDGTTKRLYVNGLCVASAPAGLLQNTASNLHIGAGGDGGTEFYFNGDVDEVAVYDKALAGARVAQHYIAARYPSVRGRGVWPGADLLVYHLDEGFGTMAHDATPGPVDGTLNGPAWSGGRFGGALSFDDAGDHVSITSFPAGKYGQLTVEMWVNLGDKEGRNELLNEQSGDSLWVNFDTNGQDKLDVYLGDTTNRGYHSTDAIIPRGEWTHVAFTYDDDLDALKLYVNGLLDREATTSGLIDLDATLLFGKRESGSPGTSFEGLADELAIYSRVLSDEEIMARFLSGPPPVIPEPATLALLGLSSLVLAARRRKRKGASRMKTGERMAMVLMMGLLLFGGAASAGYYDEVVADNPVGYWRLGETSGSTAQDAIGANNGTYTNTAKGRIGGLFYESDLAARFSGGGSKVDVPHSAALNPSGAYTVEAWARVDGSANSYRSPVTSRSNSPQGGYILYAQSNNQWGFWQGTGTGWAATTGPAVELGKWTHLVGTYDGTDMRFYVDGQLAATRPAGFNANASSPLRVGAGASEGSGGYWFNGAVDEVAVYDTAVAADRVLAHYQAGTAVVNYRLEETSGTQARDSSSNALHGVYQWHDHATRPDTVHLDVAGPTGFGSAADFDGPTSPTTDTKSEVYRPGTAKLNDLQNEYTVGAWINPDTVSDPNRTQRIFTTRMGFGFGIKGDQIKFTTFGKKDYYLDADIAAGEWTHVAVTLDANNDARFYKNGQYLGTVTGTALANKATGNSFVASTGTSEYFDGKLDEAFVYQGVMASDRINDHYNRSLMAANFYKAGHWKLEETSPAQPAADSSGKGLVGVYGTGVAANVPGPGGHGSAAYFNGSASDGNIALGTPELLSGLTNNFTVMGWINPDRTTAQERFVGSLGGGEGWCFARENDGLLFTTLGVKDYRLSGLGIEDREWTHVAVTLDADNDADFYVNGVFRGTVTHGSPGRPTTHAFTVGNGCTHPFQGLLDEVAVFSAVLTPAEIAERAQHTPLPTGPTVARYSFQSTDPSLSLIVPEDSGTQHHAFARTGAAFSTRMPAGRVDQVADGGDRSLDTSAGGMVTREINLLNNALIADAGGFTLETYLCRTVDTNAGGLEKIIDMGGSVHLSMVPGTDRLQFRPNEFGGEALFSDPLAAGQWHHAAAVFDTLGNSVDGSGNLAGAMYLYLDGLLVDSDLDAVLTAAYSDYWMSRRGISFGMHPTIDIEHFQGLLYEPRVSLAALSPDEFRLHVPEPATLTLLGLGSLVLAARRRRR